MIVLTPLKKANLTKKRENLPKFFKFKLNPLSQIDVGYYKMYNSNVKLVRLVFEENGFRKTPNRFDEWSMMWHGWSVKP